MYWSAVGSDVDWDLYGEKMSLELYKSMISKINNKIPPPEFYRDEVTSDYWQGGMPYLSIAHFSDGNGKAVPGEVHKLYVDGKKLKAKGLLFENPLGTAVWKSLKKDELNYKNLIDEDRIRISIAFIDLAHKHGESGEIFHRKSKTDVCAECRSGKGEKIYLDGYLVHLALTRVPVNPRTLMEIDNPMAKKSKPETRKEDAESILGDPNLVEEVVEATLETKSDVLVEMSEADEEPIVEESKGKKEPMDEEDEEDKEAYSKKSEGEESEWKPYGGATSLKEAKEYTEAQHESWRISDLYYTFLDVARNIMDSNEIEDKAKALASVVDEFKKSLVSKALYEELSLIKEGKLEMSLPITKSDVTELIKPLETELVEIKSLVTKAKEVTPQERNELEVELDNLYSSVMEAKAQPSTPEEKLIAIQPALSQVAEVIKSVVKEGSGNVQTSAPDVNSQILEEMRALTNKVDGVINEVATIKAQAVPSVENRVPVPRSVVVKSTPTEQVVQPVKSGSVKSIIRRSVGLS